MFASPESERVDCCALTCLGVLQSDRDRYLLQGITPPGVWRRLWLHIALPFSIFVAAGFGATHIENVVLNQVASCTLVLLLLLYLCAQCYKGRSKHIAVRKDLLWTKYHLQQGRELARLLEEDRHEEQDDDVVYLGQTRRDFGAAHPCCMLGCYPEDRLNNTEEDNEDPRDDNACSALWSFCCAPTCGMHLQFCGLCALAQEARELENKVLPPAYRRIDYITMQSYAEYYPFIYHHKWGEGTSWFPPVSRLSKRLLQALLVTLGFALVWSILSVVYYKSIGRHSAFTLADFTVFVLEWVLSVCTLAMLAWITNRPKPSELSFDAMIKFFASGFVLSVITAVCWELIVGLFIRSVLNILLMIAGVDVVVDDNGYSAQLMGFASTYVTRRLDSVDFLKTFGNDHPVFYTMVIFIESFVVAALIEELAKYFGYRMVEHPDFLSKDELEEAELIIHEEHEEEEDIQVPTTRPDYVHQQQSAQAQGAAVTLAMVCVAMGFTCCENFAYVFLYSGETVATELGTLLVRAFFPIHPLCAAIQSLGVVERDVEGSRTRKIGSIVLPALILHGSYDFFLLWIDFWYSREGDEAMDTSAGVALSLVLSVATVIAALVYYSRASGRQRQRLAAMDRQSSVDHSRLL